MTTRRTVLLVALVAVVAFLGVVGLARRGANQTASGTTSTPPPSSPTSPPPSTATPSTPTPSVSSSPAPSANAMPASEPTGWRRVYAADHWTAHSVSRDFAAYPSPWRDTSQAGHYVGLADVSVPGGTIVISLHSDSRGPRSTAIEPNRGVGQRYGRYSVRARMRSSGPGFQTTWNLWPDNGHVPSGGSITWPYGAITGQPSAFMHWATPSGGQDGFAQHVSNADWHTYTIEWAPGKVVFLLDGKAVGTSTTHVPTTSMHWVLQCETLHGGPPPHRSTMATVQIAWITVATRH